MEGEHGAPGGFNESSVLQGNVTGDGELFGYHYSWIESNRAESLLIAFACCALASAVSLYNIHQHLQHYSRPQLQRYIVRILAVVPVYALGSLLSFQFVKQALYFDTIRDCYEAFVVYCFLALVLSFAGGESVCVMKMQGEPDITHTWPLSRCFGPIGRDGRLLRSCKRATIQFVLIKPVFAMLSLVMLACGQYNSFPYQFVLTIVYNLSYSIALYGLWLFYLATKHILKPFNPVLKFFAVKSVIFLTFWQSSIIDLVPGITKEQSFVWKDFVLCLEMVPFALLHLIAFNSNQFRRNLDRLPDSEVLKNMKEVLSISDILADVYHNFMPSYQEYMLQRVDASARQGKRSSSIFEDDGPQSSASECSSTPTPHSNGFVPRFVIDDDEEDMGELERGEGGISAGADSSLTVDSGGDATSQTASSEAESTAGAQRSSGVDGDKVPLAASSAQADSSA